MNNSTSIVDIMINNSESVNLDLTARDNDGKTGFDWAQDLRKTDVINLIRTKMPQLENLPKPNSQGMT